MRPSPADGFDLDQPSVEIARQNGRRAGIADPVSALRAMKHLAGPTGTVLAVDKRVGESFSTTKNDIDWMMYGWSILHCLPVGMADKPSAETGTVVRPDTLRAYAREAG